ncbi:nudix-type nucleoside diphosphatase (YffH/AdpP family) [Yoonia maricola]|uniref:ADP-ribose pyrophosphatase n=1 Tax=Yoonia maricola TaxID=420999 RepID=A0A2M8WLE4_9RHOB|nr:NUDIX domain-containing protein [Yoonia maricola]PJI91740.1 nudix-type nucleoside diphosphatase (YffH/AdpP family) [Yoonia maricola]
MDLFVYGTLQSRDLMTAVSGVAPQNSVAAQLHGYGVFPVEGNVVPFIAKDDRFAAQGVVYENLDEAQIARLDLYEGAFGYLLDTVDVRTEAGMRSVSCYLPPDDVIAGGGSWSLRMWEENHLAPAILAATELFSRNPPPTPAAVRAMWPMVEARAWSKHRAKPAPATRRYAARPADFAIEKAQPPQGGFFLFQALDLRHRQFDGSVSDTLRREAFFGIDAAIVLPYDAVRDRVLLVEQARVGPRLRHDPNPWMLEPVAGIVDARETPQEAALRECKEEAGLELARLEPAGSFYVSPGATTDYFYTYVGLCDLPDLKTYGGGLEEEAEDLRLHPMSLGEALNLADTGEIATGPALYLLYWLCRHKERLRAFA